jgi:hypothetical protein
MKIPGNKEFEACVIGAGLRDESNRSLIFGTLEERDFSSQKCMMIFRAMQALSNKDAPIDLLTLSRELQGKEILSSELAEIQDSYFDGFDLNYYIGQIKELSTRRKLQDIYAEIENPSIEFSEIVSKTQALLDGSQTKTLLDLKVITPGDVYLYEKPASLIYPPIYQGTVNLFSGPAGKGKSIVTLSICKPILIGGLLWGRFRVTKPGPVLLIDEETPRSFLRDRFQKMGIGKDLPLYILHFSGIQIDRSIYLEALIQKIREIKPVFVVFDSLIRFHSQNENEAGAMSRVMGAFRRIANEGVTVWIIHHHKKGDGPLDQKARGSGDIVGGVDTEFSITEKDGVLTFSSVKTRMEPFGPIQLKLVIDKDQMKVVYQGTEEETLMGEVKEILQDQDRLTISQILEALQNRKLDIGINKLRKILKFSNNGIGGIKEKTGKVYRAVYFLNETQMAALGTLHGLPPINRGVDPLSVNPTLYGGDEKTGQGRESLNLDSQGIEDAPRVENEGGREAIEREVYALRAGVKNEEGAVERKSDDFEVLEDGQITY